jgi:hypothetical protein
MIPSTEAPVTFLIPDYPEWATTRTTQNPDGSVQWTKGDSLFISVRWSTGDNLNDNLYILSYDGSEWVPEQPYHWPAGYASGEFFATYWGTNGRADTKNMDILTSRKYTICGEPVQFPLFKHETTRFILTNFPENHDLWFFWENWGYESVNPSFITNITSQSDTIYLKIGASLLTSQRILFALTLPGIMPDYPSYDLRGGGDNWNGNPAGKTILFDFSQVKGDL